MSEVDYDAVAAVYAGRYDRSDYSGVERALIGFVDAAAGRAAPDTLEAGCGTGHWIRRLTDRGVNAAGLDPSAGMLRVARTQGPPGRFIRARAEALPCRTAIRDRIFCVNALHHFSDPSAFFREARRVLRPGGGVLTIGLDPHAGPDRWWIYEFFPGALVADRTRYRPAAAIRALMEASGFTRCETTEVQHRSAAITVAEAARRGFLDRTSTSQLLVISQGEYDEGIAAIREADAAASGGIVLRSDLRLYGTVGWLR